eukprot:TRINITY_DN43_c0_g1_i1.p1 TRINITY_DN43_c0_g1~~TRINITY_DN43_c0_g1_i1.p1  ORF type:complete len:352 (-),score=119.88 TRINITY_DN43_c0_g1_i1:106-1161(-)
MACCGGSGDKVGTKTNKDIDKFLQADKKKSNQQVKLLLLGAGESGKSTIFKQMKIIQQNGGYSTEELASYKSIIFGNCITQMKNIIYAMEQFEAPFSNPENLNRSSRLSRVPVGGDAWNAQVAEDIKHLWADEAVKAMYEKRDQNYQLNDSAAYFFDNIDRFMTGEYVPTQEDVLRARVRTTGIEEADFKFEDLSFKMVDVGGQRSERRKWLHCFDSVTAVIFCASLSEYDQKLREDESQNRMTESLLLFEEMSNITYFKNTPFILFLNKTDLFKEKIDKVPLSVCFPNYTGGADYNAASNFIIQRFLEKNQSSHEVFPHLTCAVNTENIDFVFKAVRKTILTKVMGEIFL